jgi:N-ethylmaleimide reductase
VIQFMHAGRIAHPANTPHGRQPVALSAVQPKAKMFTATGLQDIREPRSLKMEEIAATVRDFRCGAAAPMEAGADGVETHGANGDLIQQFLSHNANRRTDKYAGSIEGPDSFRH